MNSKECNLKPIKTKTGFDIECGEPFSFLLDFQIEFMKGKMMGGKKRVFGGWFHTQVSSTHES